MPGTPPHHSPTLPPARDVAAAEAWVRDHLGAHVDDEVVASPRFRGGQMAADAALASLDVTGYARERNEVWPAERRGATAISPYVRHGLLQLPLLWEAVRDAPARDRNRFRDELLWQEHARHLYARVGTHNARGLRRSLMGTPWPAGERPPARADAQPGPAPPGTGPARRAATPTERRTDPTEVWDPAMACLDVTVDEFLTDGYLVNQTRMWLASHWSVREGVDWRAGEDVFFRHLLDGSRAANRAGWQWTVGTATGKPYGFSRYQVEKRAPGLCGTCELRDACPIESWPEDPPLTPVEEPPRLRRDDDPRATAGPSSPRIAADPGADAEVVWLTAESLGDDDPALAAHPQLPAVFVFDAPLLGRLRLSGKRLVFLVETLADLAERRDLAVLVGDPVEALAGRHLATTFAPVPGWRRRAEQLSVVATHPWPWLVAPHGGSVASFSAWRKAARAA
jgi:deoxyribodipyrimidine photo-lyase